LLPPTGTDPSLFTSFMIKHANFRVDDSWLD